MHSSWYHTWHFKVTDGRPPTLLDLSPRSGRSLRVLTRVARPRPRPRAMVAIVENRNAAVPMSRLPLGPVPPTSHLVNVALSAGQVPLIYSKGYNISFWGLELMHPFDTRKSGRVAEALIAAGALTAEKFVVPPIPSNDDLHASMTAE